MDINDSSSESSSSESWTLMDNERWEDFAKADNEHVKSDEEEDDFIYKQSLVDILSSIKSKDEVNSAQDSEGESDGISVISESEHDSSFDFGEVDRNFYNLIQNGETQENIIDVNGSENTLKKKTVRDIHIRKNIIAYVASIIIFFLAIFMHKAQYASQRKFFLNKKHTCSIEPLQEYLSKNSKSLIVCTDGSVSCVLTQPLSCCTESDYLQSPEFQEVFDMSTELQRRFYNSKEFSKEYAILWRFEIDNPTPASVMKKLKELEIRLAAKENTDNILMERIKSRAIDFQIIQQHIRKFLLSDNLVNEINNGHKTKFEPLIDIFKLADEYSKELINNINDAFLFGQEQIHLPDEDVEFVKVKINNNLSFDDLCKRVRIKAIKLRKLQKDVQMFLSNNNLIELKKFKTMYDVYKLADKYSKELNYKITEFLSDKDEIFTSQDSCKNMTFQTTDKNNYNSGKLKDYELHLNIKDNIDDTNIYGRVKNQTIELKEIQQNIQNFDPNHSCAENFEKRPKNKHEEFEMKTEQLTDEYRYFSLMEVTFGYDSPHQVKIDYENNGFSGNRVKKSNSLLLKNNKRHNHKVSQSDQRDKVRIKKENKNGAWMHKMAKNRQKQRENHKKSDWLFERAQMRNSKQNKAMWYFSRMDDREGHRRHDEHVTKIKQKNHSKKKKKQQSYKSRI